MAVRTRSFLFEAAGEICTILRQVCRVLACQVLAGTAGLSASAQCTCTRGRSMRRLSLSHLLQRRAASSVSAQAAERSPSWPALSARCSLHLPNPFWPAGRRARALRAQRVINPQMVRSLAWTRLTGHTDHHQQG